MLSVWLAAAVVAHKQGLLLSRHELAPMLDAC